MSDLFLPVHAYMQERGKVGAFAMLHWFQNQITVIEQVNDLEPIACLCKGIVECAASWHEDKMLILGNRGDIGSSLQTGRGLTSNHAAQRRLVSKMRTLPSAPPVTMRPGRLQRHVMEAWCSLPIFRAFHPVEAGQQPYGHMILHVEHNNSESLLLLTVHPTKTLH